MHKPLLQRILNRVLGKLARALPGATSLRPMLHRLRGVKISGTVFIGDDVYIENEFPECVTIEDGAQICLRSTVIAHTRGCGQIILEKNVFIGACCTIIAADGATLRIGEGAVVGSGAVISADVPARTLVAPERTRAFAQVTVPFTMGTGYDKFRRGLRPLVSNQKKVPAESRK
jgi:acetyltransferase-like isoleucine patch superfamily enzyme